MFGSQLDRSTTSSVPFPPQTFPAVNGDASPKELLEFLKNLIKNGLEGKTLNDATHPPSREAWVAVLSGISDYFIASFPEYTEHISWDNLHEKVKLTETTLEVLYATSRVEGLYTGSQDFVQKLFAYLFRLCQRLGGWPDNASSTENGIPTPSDLRKRTLDMVVHMMRFLGCSALAGGSDEPLWRVLQRILLECLTLSEELLRMSPSFDCPITVNLFINPRIQNARKIDPFSEASEHLQPSFGLDRPSQLLELHTLLLNLLTGTLYPPLLCQDFFLDIIHRTAETTRAVFTWGLSSCATTATKYTAALVSILEYASSLSLLPSVPSDFLVDMLYLLSSCRRGEVPHEAYHPVDDVLAKFSNVSVTEQPSSIGALTVMNLLRNEDFGQGILSKIVLAYLHPRVPRYSVDTLRKLRTTLSTKGSVEGINRLSALVDRRIDDCHNREDQAMQVDVDAHRSLTWRSKVRSLVQEIVVPDEVGWMDGEEGCNDERYAQRALEEVHGRFSRPLHSDTVESRLLLARTIARLPPLIALCDPPSSSWSLHDVSCYLLACASLLEGLGEPSFSVHKAVYKVLASAIKIHVPHSVDHGFISISEIVVCGMGKRERNVRMAAGRAFAELVKAAGSHTAGPLTLTEVLFEHIYRLLNTASFPVKETTLIAVGSAGRLLNREILRPVVCCLISQLGSHNPVVKGVAYMQLLSLAKYHNVSPYALTSPHIAHTAPFLIKRMCSQPALLAEYCRLVTISQNDFVSLHLPRTLPPLFVSCDQKVLDRIGRDLSKKPSSLFLNHSSEILAQVFLLPSPAQTNRSLNFIIGTLTEAAANAVIDIQQVVKSCLSPLLVEIVVVMGDINPERRVAAVQALMKVQKSLMLPRRGQEPPEGESLGPFLKQYMLGLISDLNDRLQDVHGKQSMDSKRQIIRSLSVLITHIGSPIVNVAPQIMATMQTTLGTPDLAETTLETWYTFLKTLGIKDVGPHVGPTSAVIVFWWPTFSINSRNFARRILEHLILDIGKQLGNDLDDVVDLSAIPELRIVWETLSKLRSDWTPRHRLQRTLQRSSNDNLTVAVQSLGELKTLMFRQHKDYVQELASGDVFDPLVGRILAVLLAAAAREGDGTESLRLLAFECMSVLGAVDPDRCEIGFRDDELIMASNFMDEGESVQFALRLIQDVLVGAFRSTSDIKYQSHLAYTIQELLHFCKFTPDLVAVGSGNSVPMKVRNRWDSLPKHVLETVTPLLEARFAVAPKPLLELPRPIYTGQTTYREWIQYWASYLITKASGPTAQAIFGVFISAVRSKDAGIAHYLLPHLVLNVLISGSDDDTREIRLEVIVVLQDQVDASSQSTPDKKLLSAQAVFMLLDHLNRWVRKIRQELTGKKTDTKRSRSNPYNIELEDQLLRVDSILSSIDQNLMAKAAFECKAYARSLMSFEQQILTLRERCAPDEDFAEYFERLHEIYAHLDQPDGMEGVSTLILAPSLEHQIREHESTGRWTSAQSSWEVRLQEAPDNIDYHIGLLRCLRNLGHYDTLRTHVRGVLTRNPEWESALAGFSVESAWMVGAWDDVERVLENTTTNTAPIVMARLLSAMRRDDSTAVAESLSLARVTLGAPIAASGVQGYRRSYENVLTLHLTYELEMIHNTISSLSSSSQNSKQVRRHETLFDLSRTLSARLEATLPTFRVREPILSMRRTAFALSSDSGHPMSVEIGRSWLASAKIARKAGQWQTAYSAMLHAQQKGARYTFFESCKLTKATGTPLKALQELENSMRSCGLFEDAANVIDLAESEDEEKKMKAKSQVLRARWMNESDRFEHSHVMKVFTIGTDTWPNWESGHYHLGKFHDECYKNLAPNDQKTRGNKMNLHTIRAFAKAIRYGSKYVYQTVPRLLTLWLDMGEDSKLSVGEVFKKLNRVVNDAIKVTPVYKWYTAFPQIVSRVGHANNEVYSVLSQLIMFVIQEYPRQALWLFTSVVKSTKTNRAFRGKSILDQLKVGNPRNKETRIPNLIDQCMAMSNELLYLCDYAIDDDTKKTLSMKKDFPRLKSLQYSDLIIPLQESLTASLPPTSSSDSLHQPFPPDIPTFHEFSDEIEIMRSLAKPRKINIRGSDGQMYSFLGKPKDDLRKDARLMDFNSIINKLLKTDSEARRRQLHIRTYGVVTLNEECGFIQWVPNTMPIRPVLVKRYDARRVRTWNTEMSEVFRKIKDATDKEAAQLFANKVLPAFPPVFHEWFIETFPEPSAWLASRLTYGRTAAVMSMVGFILGLGDRHSENILLDMNTGDVVHVDFNCLFEKGRTLETPERVPFRLTQNIIDGLGVTGVEGVFRTACEVSMQLLRNNKDSLMSVLDAFIHDPLVEWEDEKRKLEREPLRRNNVNNVKPSVDLRMLARNALNPIEKKFKGIYSTSKDRHEKEISTSNLVQMLIQEAADTANLAKMYPGWAAWY